MFTIKNSKPRSWVEDFRQKKNIYCLILVLECSSSFASSRKLSAVLFFSSCFHPISMTLLERCTGRTPVQKHCDLTSLEQHWYTTWFHFVSPFRGLEPQTPRAMHQALAPSMPMKLDPKSTSVTLLLTFNASERAWGKKTVETQTAEPS